jgi:beta-glucosidase
MIFVADVESSVPRPVREFKASSSATLAPGERLPLAVTLPPRAFAFWHPDKKMWMIEPGDFTVQVGPSAHDLPLQANLSLPGGTLAGEARHGRARESC